MKGNLDLETLRKASPGLLGDLDEATYQAFRPHLVWRWVELAGGDILFQEGDPSDSLFLVISGRLRASVAGAPNGEAQTVGEIGRGESVGEMGTFTGQPRRATITALRDTLLARVETATLHKLLQASPALALKFNRLIIERLQGRNTSQKTAYNITNIAVVTISEGLDATTLLELLVAALRSQEQTVLLLTSAMIDTAAGRPGAAQADDDDLRGRRWLINHLDALEGRYDFVLYATDPVPTAWTRRCLRQADEVLLLAAAASVPDLSALEQACLSGRPRQAQARQSLVLLHPPGPPVEPSARRFLAVRPEVHRLFHVRAGHENDLPRLARFLSNRAIGLVLAGGGARGLAHLGVVRALREAGVPIDAVGGTSIGSVLGAGVALDWDWERIHRESKREFLSNPTNDYNFLPLVSLLSGRKLARILERFLGNRDIEDLWLPFFCVSSNYTQACEQVHTRGNLKRALLASMAIPGVFPPVVQGNDLLVDGSVFNNMPVDVMAHTGVRTILAVDLRQQDKQRGPLEFDQVPGTWALLFDRLRPKAKRRYRLPSMLTTLMATQTMNRDRKISTLMHDVDLLFNPDVSQFGLLEWKAFDLLVDQGYRHAREVLAQGWPLPARK